MGCIGFFGLGLRDSQKGREVEVVKGRDLRSTDSRADYNRNSPLSLVASPNSRTTPPHPKDLDWLKSCA